VGNDEECGEPAPGEAAAVMSRAISLPMLRREFQLSIRRIDAALHHGQPHHLAPVVDAAHAVARREEEFIYQGRPDHHLDGLLSAQGKAHFQGGNWGSTEQALNDVIGAVTLLDNAGFHGPYALVLSPRHYNQLFRRYEGTEMLQLEHLQRLCALGVYKAAIPEGVVIDPRVGRIIIGQDLLAGFRQQDGIHYHFHLSESVVLLLEQPRAVCTLGLG
jgi:uncharacterized linocin/CFP29 family protein